MLKLRPLIVVTGTAHVEGGEKSRRQSAVAKGKRAKSRVTVTEDLEITDDRRRANSLVNTYTRQVDRLVVIKTDYGRLVLPDKLSELQRILTELTRRAVEFNKTATTAKVRNNFVWEQLGGNRKAAVEGWLARGDADCDKEIQAVLEVLNERAAGIGGSGGGAGGAGNTGPTKLSSMAADGG